MREIIHKLALIFALRLPKVLETYPFAKEATYPCPQSTTTHRQLLHVTTAQARAGLRDLIT